MTSKAAFAFSSPTPSDMLAAAVGRARQHQRALDLVRGPVRVLGQDQGRRAGDDRSENDVPDIHM